nr:ATP-binding protein [Rhodococcus sp. BH4]
MVPTTGLNIVVGGNEAGKSTLLEAISLGLTGRDGSTVVGPKNNSIRTGSTRNWWPITSRNSLPGILPMLPKSSSSFFSALRTRTSTSSGASITPALRTHRVCASTSNRRPTTPRNSPATLPPRTAPRHHSRRVLRSGLAGLRRRDASPPPEGPGCVLH